METQPTTGAEPAAHAPPPQQQPADYRQPPPLPPAATPQQVLNRRSPFLAGFLSFFPGLGNVYNGLYVRGLAFFFLCNGLFALSFRVSDTRNAESSLAVLMPTLIFFWFFNVFDAARQAKLINLGYGRAAGFDDMPKLEQGAPGGLILGVALAVVGFYGLLETVFDINLLFLLDFWYLIFLGFGGWMIYQGLQEKNQRANDDRESSSNFPVSMDDESSEAA